MLHQVLQEVASSRYTVDVPRLAKKLSVEESALRGMIDFWVQKGRIPHRAVEASTADCDGFVCRCCPSGGSCPVGAKSSPFSGQ